MAVKKVFVALGLLISELSKKPCKGELITFSEKPQLISIQGEDLLFNTDFVRDIERGTNTNFQKEIEELVSGYSKNLVTLFLEETGILNPDMVSSSTLRIEVSLEGVVECSETPSADHTEKHESAEFKSHQFKDEQYPDIVEEKYVSNFGNVLVLCQTLSLDQAKSREVSVNLTTAG
ncbi:hypothetical protein RJ640_007536 [Escallonia rubra]|uniref:DUF7788 domain-containing protein n=1 Tax=Escallonia rubra TaxID=112253 RepID=A0AA88UNM0_9ASTE|nr:hypothetical protein RJ640_007536 [Escallonia rubra]